MDHLSGTICSSVISGKDIRFFVDNQADLIQAHHYRGVFYEREELQIISEFFRGGVFVDIGANVGNHLTFVGCFLHPQQIIPFEPNLAVLPVLRANIALNGLQRLVDTTHLGLGLGDAEGRAELVTPHPTNVGLTRLRAVAGENAVRVVTGDSILSQRRVDFVKLDVEGMEIKVLHGLRKTIDQQRPTLFVEVDQANEADFHNWLSAEKYEICRTFKRYPVNTNYLIMASEILGNSNIGSGKHAAPAP